MVLNHLCEQNSSKSVIIRARTILILTQVIQIILNTIIIIIITTLMTMKQNDNNHMKDYFINEWLSKEQRGL
jgi:hypothetical protein